MHTHLRSGLEAGALLGVYIYKNENCRCLLLHCKYTLFKRIYMQHIKLVVTQNEDKYSTVDLVP